MGPDEFEDLFISTSRDSVVKKYLLFDVVELCWCSSIELEFCILTTTVLFVSKKLKILIKKFYNTMKRKPPKLQLVDSAHEPDAVPAQVLQTPSGSGGGMQSAMSQNPYGGGMMFMGNERAGGGGATGSGCGTPSVMRVTPGAALGAG